MNYDPKNTELFFKNRIPSKVICTSIPPTPDGEKLIKNQEYTLVGYVGKKLIINDNEGKTRIGWFYSEYFEFV